MWEGEPRTDGLLRGTRNERIRQMLALKNEGWSLGTALDLHCGLLDHAHEVREVAMETLFELAAQHPIAVPLTPAGLMAYYMATFTVASGIDLAAVRCLVDLHTAEADEILIELLGSGNGSNEQFKRWVEIVNAAGRQDILRRVDVDKLSKGRQKILNQLLGR
jgi:hypothetical protein